MSLSAGKKSDTVTNKAKDSSAGKKSDTVVLKIKDSSLAEQIDFVSLYRCKFQKIER